MLVVYTNCNETIVLDEKDDKKLRKTVFSDHSGRDRKGFLRFKMENGVVITREAGEGTGNCESCNMFPEQLELA